MFIVLKVKRKSVLDEAAVPDPLPEEDKEADSSANRGTLKRIAARTMHEWNKIRSGKTEVFLYGDLCRIKTIRRSLPWYLTTAKGT